MKKSGFSLTALLAVVAVLAVLAAVAAVPAFAGAVADRVLVTTTGGSQVFTNTYNYSALELKRIWIEESVIPGNTVTVKRVLSAYDGGYTQTVGSVVCTTGAGSTASFTAAYLLPGELLTLSGLSSSNFNSVIEFEVQQH